MPSADQYGVDSVEDVVRNVFGLEGERRGVELDMLCVNPKHLDSSPSCAVNLVTGYWHCFSCGVGGDLAELGRFVMGGRSKDDIIDMLRPTTPEAKLAALQRRIARIQYRPVRARRREELPDYPALGLHPELRQRGFTIDTVEKWEFAWVEEQTLIGNKGEYTIRNSIAIPIKDAAGGLLAWCYRRTESSPQWQPRYLYTPGVEISELWWGLRWNSGTRRICVVEGALDGAWTDQCGYPALALLGSNMGDRKIRWLQQYEQVVMIPDYDNSGARWAERVYSIIGRRVPLYVAQYRPWMMKKRLNADGTWTRATDPEELLPVDLEIAVETAVPYMNKKLNFSQPNHSR